MIGGCRFARLIHARAPMLRLVLPAVAGMLLASVPAVDVFASAGMTERQAIRLALSRPAYRDLQTQRMSVAESAITEANLLPNPVIGFERERAGTPGGHSTESSIRLSQTFDVSGRRALRREAAVNRLEASRHEEQERHHELIAEVRRIFAEALYRQQHQAVLQNWQKRITTAQEIVGKLVSAGEASGYDRRRLAREAQTVGVRLAGSTADYLRAREALRGLTGEAAPAKADLEGSLMPDASPPLESLLANLQERPDLAGLQSQAAAYDQERTAAERGWIPDVTLGVGHKRIDETGRSDNGLLLGLSFAVPLFDRGQAGEQRARAQATLLRADHALKLARSQAELSGIWQQVEALRRAAAAFRSESLALSRELARIAEGAYRGGEGSLLDLLDAYRTELEAETTAIELELRARLARIELDTLSGARIHE